MQQEIHLRIVLQHSIPGTVYGLQKGKGPASETVQAQAGTGGDLAFTFMVYGKQASGSAFTLSGPFVQGTPDNRFVYLSIGSYAGQAGGLWSGRMKVPLPEAAFCTGQGHTENRIWSCTVPGTGKDGKPVFATVKPFSGWFLQDLAQ